MTFRQGIVKPWRTTPYVLTIADLLRRSTPKYFPAGRTTRHAVGRAGEARDREPDLGREPIARRGGAQPARLASTVARSSPSVTNTRRERRSPSGHAGARPEGGRCGAPVHHDRPWHALQREQALDAQEALAVGGAQAREPIVDGGPGERASKVRAKERIRSCVGAWWPWAPSCASAASQRRASSVLRSGSKLSPPSSRSGSATPCSTRSAPPPG